MAYDDSETNLEFHNDIADTTKDAADMPSEPTPSKPRVGLILGISVAVVAFMGLLLGFGLGRATSRSDS